jgi:thioredoxin reductase (NADPH)
MENVEILWDTVVEKIIGKEQVSQIEVKNIKTEESKTLDVDGVFVAVGNIPTSEVYKGIINMDKSGYIIAGEDCKTNIPGVFAAGDIRTKELRQIITAASDGANAITAVEKYLNTL